MSSSPAHRSSAASRRRWAPRCTPRRSATQRLKPVFLFMASARLQVGVHGGGGGASEACGCDDACRRGWWELRWRRIWCASRCGDGNGVVGTDVLPCLWTVLDLNSCHADERRLVGVACFSVSLQSCVLALLSSFVSSMIKPDAAASPDSTDMMTCTAFHSVPCFYDWLLCVAPWVGVHGGHSCVT